MPSRRDAVSGAVDRIVRVVEKVGLTRDQRESLAVAVTEALSNAAVHGNHLRANNEVRVSVSVIPHESVVVDVADSGKGFDTQRVADPTEPAHLLQTGGRGVFLMRRLVDELEFNAAGNRVRLTMRVRPGRRSSGPRRHR